MSVSSRHEQWHWGRYGPGGDRERAWRIRGRHKGSSAGPEGTAENTTHPHTIYIPVTLFCRQCVLRRILHLEGPASTSDAFPPRSHTHINEYAMVFHNYVASLSIQSLLNNSHLYHMATADFEKRGIDG